MIVLQTAETVEAAKGILSIESVSAISVLLLFIAFLIWDRSNLVKKSEKSQEQVFNIMKERLTDVKEHSNDVEKIRTDFKEMVSQITEVFRGSKTG